MDRQTDRRTELWWLRRATAAAAVTRKSTATEHEHEHQYHKTTIAADATIITHTTKTITTTLRTSNNKNIINITFTSYITTVVNFSKVSSGLAGTPKVNPLNHLAFLMHIYHQETKFKQKRHFD